MDEKQEILGKLFPKAVLKAMTPQARTAMPAVLQVTGMISIHAFPFRVGRESRVMMIQDTVHRIERPMAPGSVPTNDIYLLDAGELLQISREHFQIEVATDGYVLKDRGSKCGLTVAGKRVGGESGKQSVCLRDGDVIGIGTGETQYLYNFIAGFDQVRW